jgi:hypothetical protein
MTACVQWPRLHARSYFIFFFFFAQNVEDICFDMNVLHLVLSLFYRPDHDMLLTIWFDDFVFVFFYMNSLVFAIYLGL